MKRIDTCPPREQALSRITPHKSTLRTAAAVVAATILALLLTTQLAAAGDFSPCDKVKKGTSGQSYAWKKDC